MRRYQAPSQISRTKSGIIFLAAGQAEKNYKKINKNTFEYDFLMTLFEMFFHS